MSEHKLFTLGYTLFQKGTEIDIKRMFVVLNELNVTHLVDVRSVPYSKHYPECNADNLKAAGAVFSVPYLHLPELGAKASNDQDVFSYASDIFYEDIFPISKSNRPENVELYKDDMIVDFSKFRNDDFFLAGIRRIKTAYDKGFTLAVMCSERKPVDCHRYFLVSKKIEQAFKNWIDIEHIVQSTGSEVASVSNQELDKQLSEIVLNKKEIKELKITSPGLLEPAIIDNYIGDSLQAKITDFCDRYWNLMHGWKLHNNTQYTKGEYDEII